MVLKDLFTLSLGQYLSVISCMSQAMGIWWIRSVPSGPFWAWIQWGLQRNRKTGHDQRGGAVQLGLVAQGRCPGGNDAVGWVLSRRQPGAPVEGGSPRLGAGLWPLLLPRGTDRWGWRNREALLSTVLEAWVRGWEGRKMCRPLLPGSRSRGPEIPKVGSGRGWRRWGHGVGGCASSGAFRLCPVTGHCCSFTSSAGVSYSMMAPVSVINAQEKMARSPFITYYRCSPQ